MNIVVNKVIIGTSMDLHVVSGKPHKQCIEYLKSTHYNEFKKTNPSLLEIIKSFTDTCT